LADGELGVRVRQSVSRLTAIPSHYNGYRVFKSPLEKFIQAVAAAGLENLVRYLSQGDNSVFSLIYNPPAPLNWHQIAQTHTVQGLKKSFQ
jgi:hypothetical protein